MKNSSKTERFLAGKGFYIALVVCVAAVGGAAWLGVNSAMDKLGESAPSIPQAASSREETQWSVPNETPVAKKQEGVKAESKSESVVESKTEVPTETAVEQGFILPINGEILNAYSGDKVVKSKTLDDWVMHTGIDIAAEVSTPVKAMSSGKVTLITSDSMWGTTVTIDHGNGIVSYYANLKPGVNVVENQNVKMGDVIGAVGDTCDIERAEESHLHFSVKQGNEYIDPMSIMK